MSSSTTQATIDRHEIYRQANQILNANFLHFILISLLFLPITFSTSAAIQLYFSSFTIIASFQSMKTLIFIIAFTFFVILLPTVAGIALIIHTTNQSIHRQRLTFSSTIKSLSYSYIPLLSTFIAGFMNSTLIFLLFILSRIAITKANKALGFPFDLSTFSIILINVFVLLYLFAFFMGIWGSAPAIAVLELKSGFEPLRLSANQSSEFRSHSFFFVLSSGYYIGLTMFSSLLAPIFSPTTTNWISILNVFLVCFYSSHMILQYVITNTVLYIQCKVVSGEFVRTAVEEEEVSGEYVSLAVVNNEEDDVSGEEEGYRGSIYSCILWVSYLLWYIFILMFKVVDTFSN